MKKSLSAVVLLGIAASLVFVGAPAANAAPPIALPPGQTLYAIDCDAHGSQLWSFTPDGAATPIGTATGAVNSCGGGAQTDPTSGISYFIYYPGAGVTALATVDVTTGVVTTIAAVNGDTTDAWQLIITNSGAAFIVDGITLYTIDLSSAATVALGSITPVNPGAVGYDALTDTIYGFNNSNTMGIFTIDRTNGVATDTGLGGNWPVATCLAGGTSPGHPDGVTFDSAGFAWIQSDSCTSNIMSVDMSTGASSMVGELHDATATLYATAPNDFYSETFFIRSAPIVVAPPAAGPALAATGIDTAQVGMAGSIAALAALLGIALLVRRRRAA